MGGELTCMCEGGESRVESMYEYRVLSTSVGGGASPQKVPGLAFFLLPVTIIKPHYMH